MDILFTKWWMHALLKPLECGLLKSCAPEQGFMTDLKQVVKVLKVILYNKSVPDLNINIPGLEVFITEKK